jgi:hypothetical protein
VSVFHRSSFSPRAFSEQSWWLPGAAGFQLPPPWRLVWELAESRCVDEAPAQFVVAEWAEWSAVLECTETRHTHEPFQAAAVFDAAELRALVEAPEIRLLLERVGIALAADVLQPAVVAELGAAARAKEWAEDRLARN